MGRGLKWYILTLAIGLSPVLLLPLTWSPDGIEPWMRPLRTYAAPVLFVEFGVIIYAVLDGLLPTLGRIRLPRSAAIAATVLVAIAVITPVFAPAPIAALERTLLWFTHVLFGLAILHLSGRAFGAGDLVRSYAVGFALFAVVFVLLVAQVRDTNFDWTYGLPAFSHIRHFGYYALAAVGLSAGIMAVSTMRGGWTLAFALASTAFGLSLWTGSRGAIIGAAGGVLAGVILVPAMRRRKAWGGIAASLGVAWIAVAQLPAPAENMGAVRTVAATAEVANITTGRTEIWRRVTQAVMERPLFGHGEGQMRFAAPFYNQVQPHNVVLQILLAWGAVGLLCVLVLSWHFLKGAIPIVRSETGELVPPFVAILALTSLSLIDGSLYHVLPLSIFAASVGMVAAGWMRAAGTER